MAGVQEMGGKLAVSLEVCPKRPKVSTGKEPRCQDLDNLPKSVLDSLQGFAYANDAQIWALSIKRGEPVPGGCLHVQVEQL